jgi:CHAT domain-containing protein/Tfp pilus assembly protein PilF
MFTRATFYLLTALAAFLISCSKEQQAAKETPTTEQVAPEKTASASVPEDTTLAGKYFMQAEKFAKDAQYDSAIIYFGKAGAISEAEQNWQRYVQSYNEVGRNFYWKGAYDQAMAYLNRALETGLLRLGEKHFDVAVSYSHKGGVARAKGDYEQAIALHQKGLAIRLALLGEKDRVVAVSYNNIANAYLDKGDYDQALVFQEKALPIYLATLGEQHRNVAYLYHNIGDTYLLKRDYDQALVFHQKSLTLKQAVLGKRHPHVAWTYNALGEEYSEKGDYGRAIACINQALSIFQESLGTQHIDAAGSYDLLGRVYANKGDAEQARKFLKKSLAIKLAAFGERHPKVADSYTNLGQVYLDQGDYDQALGFYQQALGANTTAFNDTDPYINPPLDNLLWETSLLASLKGKSQALAKRYSKPPGKPRDLAAAVSTCQLASQLIDQMRRGYNAEGSKLVLQKESSDLYDHAIQTALRLDEITNAAEHRQTAFLFAEKSKAGILLETLSETEAKRFAGIPDSLLAKEKQLRLDLAFYDNRLTEERLKRADADSAQIAFWQDKVFGLKQAYDALLLRFEKDYPDYYNLKYQVKTVSVSEVQQQLLDDRTALVEYFTGKDSIFIFAITKNDFTIKTSVKDSLFAQQIEQLRQGIIEQDFARYTQAAVRLYQILLAPVASMLDGKNLIIVPDGALSAIPFEALLTHAVNPAGGLKDYPELPYLLEAHAISYAYSATLLEQEQRRRKQETKRDYLALAPVFPEGLPAGTRGAAFIKENFAEDSSQAAPATRLRSFLPATKTEVTGIFARFENSYSLFERWFGNKSRVYLEREAKEEKLKSADLSSYRFLHFATHGLVNEKNPKLSGLILTQENTTSKEDGILRLGEIYNLNLNADLVVLSACETGLGQIAQGEGIIGLTRGFLYAGASNVLVSLWQVSDMTTSDLMVDFYDKMLVGMSKAEALAEAKRQMIRRDPGYAKPYYWAPFILVGR